MYSLLGDRFLKWFLGNHSKQNKATPASENKCCGKTEDDMTIEPENVLEKGCLDGEMALEMNSIGERTESNPATQETA